MEREVLMKSAEQVGEVVQGMAEGSRERMGREYASAYEAWAVLADGLERAKSDMKALEKLHTDLWKATREGNEDEVLIELRQAGSSATLLSAQLAPLPAAAQRAAEELRRMITHRPRRGRPGPRRDGGALRSTGAGKRKPPAEAGGGDNIKAFRDGT